MPSGQKLESAHKAGSARDTAMSQALLDPTQLATALADEGQRLANAKAYLQALAERQNERFANGDDIEDIIIQRAALIDQLIEQLWQSQAWPEDITLVAVGGYGRGELHPYSDIDLLILLGGEPSNDCAEKIQAFITLLWDIKLDIGHSVRTLDECINAAAEDITIATNLMESRVLCGNNELYQSLMDSTGPEQIWPSREFFRAKWDEQIERHRKYGNSEYNLEPNLKSCPGGLRDIQMIGWVAKRHFGVNSIEELVELGFLSEEEMQTLQQGLHYLWRVRFALHQLTSREEDRLLFDHQRALAAAFGHEDDDYKMAVEGFMQVYYRWAFALGQLNDVMMQHFDETILRACEAETILELNQRFNLRNGHIEVSNNKVFEKTPSALMEIFVLMAQNNNIDGVRASTIRLIRNSVHLIDDEFRADAKNKRYFMELLRSPNKVALQLRRMLRFGVLSRYLPEFGPIMGQMQHDLFHIYSVDAHTMAVVKNMRRFLYDDASERYPVASRVMRRLEKPELLYIAGLYHDIAKGRGGDHSTLGAVDAREFCERHELGRRDTHLVSWLVDKHLLMSAVAQRADINDPEVIHDFAREVGDILHLDYLFLLTVADINGTNPTLWNSWRASLLRQLYTETRRALRHGLENPIDKQDWIEEVQQNAIHRLEDYGFEEEEVRELWAGTNDDYFTRESVEDVVWHTRAIAEHHDLSQPMVLIQPGKLVDKVGATQIFVHTKDQPWLFAVAASALEQLNLSVCDARAYSSGEYAMETFYVLEADGQPIAEDSERVEEIRSLLMDYIREPERFSEIMSRRTPRQMRLFNMPTRTSMATDINKAQSVLEVITPDRPGLLAKLGRIFFEYGIVLQNAKITTLGERVEDVFFLTDQDNNAIEDPALCAAIQDTICKELDEQAAA